MQEKNVSEQDQKVKTVKLKLLADHTHANMAYSAGMEIEVPEADAKWLKDLKIAEYSAVNKPAVTKPTVEEK
ncbi:hypothetical protein D7V21_16205 [Acinetobacter guerrae]|uniref:DUF7210 domain-containing protein n=1 Tax=Acinetobacter guerrae TaxID=1843371 RepID=A0A3A8EJT9_9GAMM|nr:hypothetical protein [Acinetobacter guerrae]RKG30284.1 hypothetical protein D7V21_16205 [Acinetobacter guerrae]